MGNSVELKNVILFDGVQVPHYYMGDSILGHKAHMGAKSITSNVKFDRTLVIIRGGVERIEASRKNGGAFLVDFAEIGCNSVLNPQIFVGQHTNAYPTSCVRGAIPTEGIYKTGGVIASKKQEER